MQKYAGGIMNDESCIISKYLHGWRASWEHKDHTFLYVEESSVQVSIQAGVS